MVVDVELGGRFFVGHLKPAHTMLCHPPTDRIERSASREDNDVVALRQAAEALSGARHGIARDLVSEVGALLMQDSVEVYGNHNADSGSRLGHALTLR
jgi:hypothetical protein